MQITSFSLHQSCSKQYHRFVS